MAVKGEHALTLSFFEIHFIIVIQDSCFIFIIFHRDSMQVSNIHFQCFRFAPTVHLLCAFIPDNDITI